MIPRGRTGLLFLCFLVVGCSRKDGPTISRVPASTLRIGFGLTGGARTDLAAQLMTQEALVNLSVSGRPVPWLAKSWSYSDDGLSLRIVLQPNAWFHDGTPLTAEILRGILLEQLPAGLGPVYDDIADIRVLSPSELVFSLKRRSTLLLEGLNVLLHAPNSRAGTGPFSETERRENSIELRAFEKYYGGRPAIDRIAMRSYPSVRSAWADMLRGQLDMVYELGIDAFELTRSSRETRVFTFQRPYSYVVVLNIQKPAFRDREFRRALNGAINRDQLVSNVLESHGRVADGPIWPQHWIRPEGLRHFRYDPKPASRGGQIAFTCLYSDPSIERVALFIQQQLQAVGVNVKMELSSIDDTLQRVNSGQFDAWLADVGLGPSLFRQYLFWHSGSPYNWGHYSSKAVDGALDSLGAARDDAEYRSAAAAFQESIIEDPPAIFLAWSDRARAVSNRFDVHVEPDRDIVNTLRLWRPADSASAAHN